METHELAFGPGYGTAFRALLGESPRNINNVIYETPHRAAYQLPDGRYAIATERAATNSVTIYPDYGTYYAAWTATLAAVADPETGRAVETKETKMNTYHVTVSTADPKRFDIPGIDPWNIVKRECMKAVTPMDLKWHAERYMDWGEKLHTDDRGGTWWEGERDGFAVQVSFFQPDWDVVAEAPAEDVYTDEEQEQDAAYLASTAWRFATDQERRTDDMLIDLGRIRPVALEEER